MAASSKKRIKKTEVSKASPSGINATKLKPPEGISFSFKYFDNTHEKFFFHDKDGQYWITLMERMKALSDMTASILRKNNNNKTLRCHPINWQSKSVSETCFGIPGEEQLVDTPYQFSLSANKHGRVHGFFIEEVFYVVWLDPDHKLYPGNPAKN